MKIDIKHFALAAAGATMLLTSCIGDLDTLPLNPSDSTSETVYGKDENGYLAGLTKLYFNFVSNDTTDLQVSDGGASELIRAFWTIQEVTADACKCAWENDAWVRAMNTDTWSDADNDATYAVYVRTLQGIAYVNEYLRQTASDKLSDRGVSSELAARIQSFRAEARFLRAYFYWIALDVFGDVPFTTETSPFGGGVNPKQASRKDVFDYCISELTDLASDESAMPAARSNYPRADKGDIFFSIGFFDAYEYHEALSNGGFAGSVDGDGSVSGTLYHYSHVVLVFLRGQSYELIRCVHGSAG